MSSGTMGHGKPKEHTGTRDPIGEIARERDRRRKMPSCVKTLFLLAEEVGFRGGNRYAI